MKLYLPLVFSLLLLAACQSQHIEPSEPIPPAEEQPAAPPVSPPQNPTSIEWTSAAAAPIGHMEAQSIVLDGKLYVFGGYTDLTVIPKTFASHVYDPQAETWTQLPDLPRPMTHAGVAAAGRHIYLAGGVVGSSDPSVLDKIAATEEVWAYHVDEQTWRALPPLPEARGAGELAFLNETLHFFGGTSLDREESLGDHWTLSLNGSGKNAGWTDAAPFPNPRNHFGSAVVGGKIYAIGGQHGHNQSLVTQNSVHVWDPAEPESWQEVASLPYGLGHISSSTVVLGGLIYVIGGETDRFVYSDDVLVYDPETDSWSFATSLPEARHSASSGAVDGKLIVTGGSDFTANTFRGIVK